MGNEHDAEDVMQEASLRAFRYFRTFTGGNARAWFLRIVHNTCCASRSRRVQPPTDLFDEEHHSGEGAWTNPETLFLRGRDIRLMEDAINHLPVRLRQLLVLRELEGWSYRELADALRLPIGTVMSRLSRARQALRTAMDDRRGERGGSHGAAIRHHDRDRRRLDGVFEPAGGVRTEMQEEGL
jgi:RNA polymerase sigma-70 factor (ECF subfamily)